jgi:hypothetical protein
LKFGDKQSVVLLLLVLVRNLKDGTILVGKDYYRSHQNTLQAKCFLDISLVLSQDFLNLAIQVKLNHFARSFDFHAQERFHNASACVIKNVLVKFEELVTVTGQSMHIVHKHAVNNEISSFAFHEKSSHYSQLGNYVIPSIPRCGCAIVGRPVSCNTCFEK